MKKSISLFLSLLMVFSFTSISLSASAEGNTYTVGANADFASLADAVASVSDGDTIKLVENITATNISLDKSITIDTNGYVWTGGTSSKVNCASIKSGAVVSIINSTRTAQVTSDITDFDIVCNSVKNQGIFVLNNNASLTLKNIAAKSTNAYTNNQPCVVYSMNVTTATLTTDNCYFTSANWGAVGGNNSAMQISAKDSIFGGSKCSVFYVGSASSTVDSVMSFDNCTFLSPISACNASNATAVNNATSTFDNVTYNFKDCTATSLFAPSATAVFDGNCAFNTVKSGVVVKAGEGVTLYSDANHTQPLASNIALENNSAVYSVGGSSTGYKVFIDNTLVGEVSKGSNYTLPIGTADGFVCYTNGTDYYAENSEISIESDLNLTSVSIGKLEMLSGAAMRINNKTGIRFYTSLDTAKIAELLSADATISMGTLIAPENLLGGADLTLAVDEANRVDVPFTTGVEDGKWYTENEFSGMVGSLVNIRTTTNEIKGNELRKYIGRGYVTVTIGGVTKTVYAEYADGNIVNNTRSVSFLAKSLADSSSDLYLAHKDEVDAFANMYNSNDEF